MTNLDWSWVYPRDLNRRKGTYMALGDKQND